MIACASETTHPHQLFSIYSVTLHPSLAPSSVAQAGDGCVQPRFAARRQCGRYARMTVTDEQISYAQATAIVAAAQRYRDALRRYLAMQIEAMEGGERFDALAGRTWLAFREAERAEEALFALLDALDAQ